jgi:hypothetical protein
MIDWLMYSGCNIIIKLNPLHWRLSFKHNKTNEVWEQDALVIELLPVTIRLWFDNGEW